GDFAIWKSILKLGSQSKKDIIFVCDEQKHDWVYRSNKVPLVPRMELCDEYFGATGKHFTLLGWTRFLELAGAKEATIKEARRAERWADADDRRLMPIVKRVRALLDDIREIVVEGPQDEGSGYELLREGDLVLLRRSMRTVISADSAAYGGSDSASGQSRQPRRQRGASNSCNARRIPGTVITG